MRIMQCGQQISVVVSNLIIFVVVIDLCSNTSSNLLVTFNAMNEQFLKLLNLIGLLLFIHLEMKLH